MAWERARSSGGPLDDASPAAAWRPTTAFSRERAWGRYLAYLKACGELDPAASPASRLTVERLGRFIAAARQVLRATTLQQLLVDIGRMAAALAPERDWRWVRAHPARPTAAQLRAERKPIAPFDPAALAAAAIAQCRDADSAVPTSEQSVRYRDGVLVLLATLLGLRLSNLAGIRIGEHLLVEGTEMRVVFAGSETKTSAEIDTRLPDWFAVLLRRYLAVHRPRLLGNSRSDRLWINRRGRPLASTALYPLFTRIGNQMIGRPIHPHLVRHSLATTLLGEHPGRMRLAADALTHRTQGQVSATYDRSGNTAALRVWKRLIRRTQSGNSRP